MEDKCIASCLAVRELMWLKKFTESIGVVISNIPLFLNNQSTIKLIENEELHKSSKHIDVQYNKRKIHRQLSTLKIQ